MSHTLPAVLQRAAKRYGARTAVIDGETRLTFAEVARLARRLARQLLGLGLRKGDVIGVQMPNSWRYIVVQLGVSEMGGVLAPLHMPYRKHEISFMLRHVGARAVFTVDRYKGFAHGEMMSDLAGRALPGLQHVIVAGEEVPAGALDFAALLREDPPGVTERELAENAPAPGDPLTIMFTSGTEADPKAALHTHATFVPNHLHMQREYGFAEDDVILSLSAFSHMYAAPMILAGLAAGALQVTLEAYDPERYLELAQRHGVTRTPAVPAHWFDILRLLPGRPEGLRLRQAITAGAKAPPDLLRRMQEQLGCVVTSQWGMTEVCAATYTRRQDSLDTVCQTVGRACPEGEVACIDENGRRLPPGEQGELAFRGPSKFVEYLGNPEGTRASHTPEGWFRTGDLAWLDERGYVHFVGRLKDTINRGGMKIQATELEDLLLGHPAIRQAGVLAWPDERLGERICAFVALQPGSPAPSLGELSDYLLARGLARFKLPERLEIRPQLPTTASGKVQKGALRDALRRLTAPAEPGKPLDDN